MNTQKISIQTIAILNKGASELSIEVFYDNKIPVCVPEQGITDKPDALLVNNSLEDSLVNSVSINSGDMVAVTKNNLNFFINEVGDLVIEGKQEDIDAYSINVDGDLEFDYCN